MGAVHVLGEAAVAAMFASRLPQRVTVAYASLAAAHVGVSYRDSLLPTRLQTDAQVSARSPNITPRPYVTQRRRLGPHFIGTCCDGRDVAKSIHEWAGADFGVTKHGFALEVDGAEPAREALDVAEWDLIAVHRDVARPASIPPVDNLRFVVEECDAACVRVLEIVRCEAVDADQRSFIVLLVATTDD